ncbi:MAG: cytochrome c [Alphaproteobacteria bacterium]|jgi:mono/diheme cytochrome c family protein|nr:cytochrome c [Alphaproteobacteria bacterium]MDP6567264.1 cytochrome c [Alphaproteobacteria bacterium]MDP6811694.1 cytochrome c [Alphaproteobacteria bacterium]
MTVVGKSTRPAIAVLAAAVLAAGVIWYLTRSPGANGASVTVPELSGLAKAGQKVFEANCVQCHGNHGSGGDKGPPLIHRIYEPSHHGDESFRRAAAVGVRQHHWRFGDMPPQPQVKHLEIQAIVQYIREVQRANGIH